MSPYVAIWHCNSVDWKTSWFSPTWAGREGNSHTGTTVCRQAINSSTTSLTGNLHQKSSPPSILLSSHTEIFIVWKNNAQNPYCCFEEELRICFFASPENEREPVASFGTSPDEPKLMRKSMGSQAKNVKFLLVISRNWTQRARHEPFMVPVQPLLLGKPIWQIRLDLLQKCHWCA